MPNEALDPDCLVGRILAPQEIQSEPLAEAEIPLWRVMHVSYWTEAGADVSDDFPPAVPDCYAAEIESLRDWLLPDEHEPPMVRCSDPTAEELLPRQLWRERERLRDLLTEQARIARGEG